MKSLTTETVLNLSYKWYHFKNKNKIPTELQLGIYEQTVLLTFGKKLLITEQNIKIDIEFLTELEATLNKLLNITRKDLFYIKNNYQCLAIITDNNHNERLTMLYKRLKYLQDEILENKPEHLKIGKLKRR